MEYLHRGNLLLKCSKFEEAQTNYEMFENTCKVASESGSSIATTDNLYKLYCNRSAAELGLLNIQGAIEYAERAVQILPEKPLAYYRLAIARYNANLIEDCLVACEIGLTIANNNPVNIILASF